MTLNIFFQASDDYYNRWEVATFARILRYISSFIAIGLPGFYIAIANYHPEILPTPFMLSIVSAREGVPFPVVVEVLLLELAFELLREAGIRLPGQLGGTIGIVGGLIVGQAAVDANIVSTIVVIVVAFTAIASFSIPIEIFYYACLCDMGALWILSRIPCDCDPFNEASELWDPVSVSDRISHGGRDGPLGGLYGADAYQAYDLQAMVYEGRGEKTSGKEETSCGRRILKFLKSREAGSFFWKPSAEWACSFPRQLP